VLLALSAAALPAAAVPAQARAYDLGRIMLQTPGPKGPLPLHLRGAIGVPLTPGRHPIVLLLNGRNETGCPDGPFDTATWPCFARENQQRWLDLAAGGLLRRHTAGSAPAGVAAPGRAAAEPGVRTAGARATGGVRTTSLCGGTTRIGRLHWPQAGVAQLAEQRSCKA
jgi:hypothetical protein